MLLNIKTGYGGVQQRPNDEIVILVSSLIRLEELGSATCLPIGMQFLPQPDFSADRADLGHVDFEIPSATGLQEGRRRIRGSSSAIKPKPWLTSAFRWKP